MTRILSLLITLPFTLFVILFAVSNTQDTAVHLNLFDMTYELPQYALSLGMMALGFTVGGLLVWLNLYGYRIRYWQVQRKNTRYEEQIEKIKKDHLESSEKLTKAETSSTLISDQSAASE